MAKDPAFLFYAQDWITGTLTMTMDERGQYITLLAVMHQKGRIDEKTIRFLVGNVSDNLKDKFSIDANGKWFNDRLEEEIEKRSKFAESRRKNGSKGGRPKASGKPNAKPSGKPTDNHTEDENEDEVLDLNKESDFDIFWNLYGSKLDRVLCENEWFNIDDAEYSKILLHVPKFVKASGDYLSKPLNYLKGRRWQDEDLPDYATKQSSQDIPVYQRPYAERVKFAEENGIKSGSAQYNRLVNKVG